MKTYFTKQKDAMVTVIDEMRAYLINNNVEQADATFNIVKDNGEEMHLRVSFAPQTFAEKLREFGKGSQT